MDFLPLFLSYFVFPSLLLCSSVLFLKFHTWVKSYGIVIPQADLFPLAKCRIAPLISLQMARFHSFWWLSNIPVCVCVCVCVCVSECLYIYTPPLLYPMSVNGHLGSFHDFAIVDHVAINIRVQVHLWIGIFISFGKYLVVHLLGHRLVHFFKFLRNLHTAIQSGCTILHFHQRVRGLPFLHILSNTWCFLCCSF